MATSYVNNDYIEGLKKLRQQQQKLINQQKTNKANALKSSADAQIAEIYSQMPALESEFKENTKNAYVQKRKAQNELPQLMAAKGYTGGLTESSNIALENQYQNAYTAYKNRYEQAIDNLKAQIQKINSSLESLLAQNDDDYALKLSQSNSDYDKMLLDARAKLAAQSMQGSGKTSRSTSKSTKSTKIANKSASAKGSASQERNDDIVDQIYFELSNYFPLNTMQANDGGVRENIVNRYLNGKMQNRTITRAQASAIRKKFLNQD